MKILNLAMVYILFIVLPANSQWVSQTVPGNVSFLLSIKFKDANTGLSCGWFSGFTGRILHTTSGGNSWQNIPAPNMSRSMVECEYVSEQQIYIAGASNLSSDMKHSNPNYESLIGSDNTANVRYWQKIGIDGKVNYRASFFRSTNGGMNWSEYGTIPPQFTYLTAMDFANANTGYVIGHIQDATPYLKTNILKTINGGLTWTIMLSENVRGELQSVQYVNDNLIVASGFELITDSTVAGVFLKSTNNGATWNKLQVHNLHFAELKFINNLTGFCTGFNSNQQAVVYRTTDQGSLWFNMYTLDNAYFEGINFSGESGIGIVFGEKLINKSIEPFVARTPNFGQTWNVQQINDQSEPVLVGSFMHNQFNYYISGGNFVDGKIFHTTNGGSVFIENNSSTTPSEFSLKQNYPNPFNPETIIEYEISKRSNVVIKVYNALGKEVSMLVNEVKSAGVYNIKFNAENFAGGIYYYEIQVNGTGETKKMVLVK
jgi:photosystem II stability/assembly factor-like uncharacterized protein